MKAALITVAILGALLWIFAPNAHMRGVPPVPAIIPPPTVPAMTTRTDPWFADDTRAARAAYRQRLAEFCAGSHPDSLDYRHCEEAFDAYEEYQRDRAMRDDRDNEDAWIEAQQAHQDALELGR